MDHEEMKNAVARATSGELSLRGRTIRITETLSDIGHSEIEPYSIRLTCQEARVIIFELLTQIDELKYWAYEAVFANENKDSLLAQNMMSKLNRGVFFGSRP
jgi:hypothetical protein